MKDLIHLETRKLLKKGKRGCSFSIPLMIRRTVRGIDTALFCRHHESPHVMVRLGGFDVAPPDGWVMLAQRAVDKANGQVLMPAIIRDHLNVPLAGDVFMLKSADMAPGDMIIANSILGG